MRSDDLLVMLKLAADGSPDISVRALESELGISKSAVAKSMARLERIGLLQRSARERRINRLALRDLIAHGARWIAPAQVGDFELGLPTAHAAPPLAEKLRGDADLVVIPLPHGPVRGRAVEPIHPKAPQAAQRDPKLHRLLAIVDAFRIGGAREREVASAALRECI